ncbi:MAG: UDP-N-acetylglucosamine 2-epimerase, partial [Flavitalea sp.]
MKNSTICVVTGSRAEYGLLYWTMKIILNDPDLTLKVAVTGMHLSSEFGNTYKQIESDGFVIDKKIEILLSSDTGVGVSKSTGLGIIGFSEAFSEMNPDLILILGDRFEILSAAIAALFLRIPVAHCHGGESTEGAFDESIRHAITKMSHIHFASTEQYKNRIIQMGEKKENVYNVGALGIENINKLKLLTRSELETAIQFKFGGKNVLVNFHPETLADLSQHVQFECLLQALMQLEDVKIIFTKANA